MSTKYTIKVPDGAARWGTAMSENITKCIHELAAEIKETMKVTNSNIQNMDSKFDRLSAQILADVTEAKSVANNAMDIAVAAEASVAKLEEKVVNIEKHMLQLKIENRGLKEENAHLTRRSDNQDTYSRRDNLVIRGVSEGADEDDNACENAARDFFKQQLRVDDPVIDRIQFVRCHRLGKKLQYSKRPIIVRFEHFSDRQLIWNRRIHLKGKAYSLHENFANDVEYRRRLMYPILAAARKSAKHGKVYLNDDVLKINGTEYTSETLGRLPGELHPSNFSVRHNEHWTVFGGIHSRFNFLSNFYHDTITYENIPFDDIEHAYQYAKARKFDDVDTSEKILSARTPSDAKRIGASVHGFKPRVWDKVREDVMLKLLRIKFAPGSDMATKLVATAGKSLAEAGQSVTFSIGMSLNNRDLFKTDKWTKNVLGKLLMKVREELS